MSQEKQKKRIYDRYFRQVISYPNGAVVHYGDCEIYSAKVCTCGLLSDLLFMGEDQEEIYSDFWKEYAVHEAVLRECQEMLRERPEDFKFEYGEMGDEEWTNMLKFFKDAGWKTAEEIKEENKE